MSERHLAQALLKADVAEQTASSQSLAEAVLASEKHRIRELIVLTTFLWGLAIATMGWLIWFGWGILSSIARQPELPESVKTQFLLLGSLTATGIVITTLAILLLVFAGSSTIFLMYRLRQVTLRQINASLMQISAQLELLQSQSDAAEPRSSSTK
ncbi:MAG: hypothetical protein U0872_02510 [Planctomycetaceae bacterium]